jgi:hypothetical protein
MHERLTAAMTNCCIRVAGNSNFLNFVHSSGEYAVILAATRHGGETLYAIFQKVLKNDVCINICICQKKPLT